MYVSRPSSVMIPLTIRKVAGEIRNKDRKFDRKTLEIGAILGVTATWILYVLATVAIVCCRSPLCKPKSKAENGTVSGARL
jgi:hypothetical protein